MFSFSSPLLRCAIPGIVSLFSTGFLSGQTLHFANYDLQPVQVKMLIYFSYPDYTFDRLRKEAAGKYESYADMGLNEWIQMKIVVKDTLAKLYLNDNLQPALVVSDLKLGADNSGAIGLFVDTGTDAFFRDIKVVRENLPSK